MPKQGRIRIAPPGTKYCPRCERFKQTHEFGAGSAYCTLCTRSYWKKWNEGRYEEELKSLRESALEYYGHRCGFCGEQDDRVLTIYPFDKGVGLYRTLKALEAQGWSPDYKMVCLNCREKLKQGIIKL